MTGVQSRRVLVVDDHPVMRRGLRVLLEGQSWVAEVLEAASVAEAVRVAVSRQVDVVAMDVVLPDGDGLQATRRVLRARPQARVLIFTMSADDEVVSDAIRAGAHGYLIKDADPESVVDALRTVALGGVVLGPQAGTALLGSLGRQPTGLPPPFDELTVRELEILTRLASGDSNIAIARRLGVTEKTVRNQLSIVFAKLGVSDRVNAALLAREAGIGVSPRHRRAADGGPTSTA
jgi:two-component system, NarL family, nitrate/nitrite response regulator NarL